MHNNFSLDAKATARTVNEICALAEKFLQVNVIGTNADAELRCSKSGKITVSGLSKLTGSIADGIVNGIANEKSVGGIAGETVRIDENNRKKVYILDGSEPFLRLLGISDATGRIYDKKQPKFRQINRYLEFIEDIVRKLPTDRPVRIVDFGCGKSYLTFAMYYYLHVLKGYEVRITGLDLKADVIALCNRLAEEYGYTELHFEQGDISSYEGENQVDMVVTLHACDTATDYAIEKAVRWNAAVIMVVPCWQHELNRQIRCEELKPILKYGLIKERMAALMTDALRADILEEMGYEVQILEFIDMEHTPKNILIRAVKKSGIRRKTEDVDKVTAFLNVEPTLRKLLGKEQAE